MKIKGKYFTSTRAPLIVSSTPPILIQITTIAAASPAESRIMYSNSVVFLMSISSHDPSKNLVDPFK